jgi:branched-chain amino acid transport system substrate-binding protein
MHDMYLVKVKSPTESKYQFDDYKVLSGILGGKACRSLSEGGCNFADAKK